MLNPVLPNEQRSHRDVPGTDQICMERIVAMLTDKHQAMIWPIGITRVSTHRAHLAGVVGINLLTAIEPCKSAL